jgi:hypothetical protein
MGTTPPEPSATPADAAMSTAREPFGNLQFIADYRVSMEVFGVAADGTVRWYQQAGRARADFAGRIGTEDVQVVFISEPSYGSGQFRYLCSRQAQVCLEFDEDDFGVFESQPPEAVVFLIAPKLDARQQGFGIFDESSRREVAGEATSCFETSEGDDPSQSKELCSTEDGIVLVLEERSTNVVISLEASSLARDVDGAVFEAPFPALDQELAPRN